MKISSINLTWLCARTGVATNYIGYTRAAFSRGLASRTVRNLVAYRKHTLFVVLCKQTLHTHKTHIPLPFTFTSVIHPSTLPFVSKSISMLISNLILTLGLFSHPCPLRLQFTVRPIRSIKTCLV